MKKTIWKNKKILCGVITAVVLCAGLGSYLFFHVEAQGILTGLEEKVSEKVKDKNKFQIVEVIPDASEGEIGYLVKNQKENLVGEALNHYLDTYLSEDASRQNTQKIRKEYVNSLESKLSAYTGEGKPLQMEGEYEEAYFPEDTENWNVIEFSDNHYETVQLQGSYEEDPSLNGLYEPNIKGFQYDKDQGAYMVNFTQTMRTDTTEEIYTQAYRNTGIDENGNLMMEPAGENPEGTLYYIESFSYMGSGSSGSCYTPVLDTEIPYLYVGEKGAYQFKEGGTEKNTVQIGRIYYKGGLTSQDWMRTKVLASKDSADLDIEVLTVEESKMSELDFTKADFIYICGDTTKNGLKYKDTQKVWDIVSATVTQQKTPCVIDASSGVWEKCALYQTGYTGQQDFIHENVYIFGNQTISDHHAVFENFEDKIADTTGLSEVLKLVKQENMIRSGEEKLSMDLTRLFLLQYIIDYSNQRKIAVKENLHVLQIQPSDAAAADTTGFELTKEKIAAWAGISDSSKVVIDTMSTAEFIGKVDDLNKEYDLIYIGSCIDNFNTTGSGTAKKTVYNEKRLNGLIYMHTGDYVAGNFKIIGMMDMDYGGAYEQRNNTKAAERPVARNLNNYLQNNGGIKGAFGIVKKYVYYQNRTTYTEQDGKMKLMMEFKKASPQVCYQFNRYLFDDLSGDLGVYRYSGNDITKTRLNDIMSYVQANYPVLVSDTLYKTDTSGNKSVNTETVDNTSYLYKLLDTVKNNENVFSVSDIKDTNSNFENYLNLPKPQILYFNPDFPERLEEYNGIQTAQGESFVDVSKMQVDTSMAQSRGTYLISTGFYLDSTVDASSSEVYVPKMYVDLNADGKFLKSGTGGSSEQMNCTIYNVDAGTEAQKDANGNYQIFSKVHYRMEREIPATYRGVLTWKLELVQAANQAIRTSDVQYTKIDGIGDKEQVRVLQITSNNGSKDTTTLSLSSDSSAKGYDAKIQEYLGTVKMVTGLDFNIQTITGDAFGKKKADSAQDYYEKYLSQYDMLIVGFGDMYCDLSNKNHAVDAIDIFIDTGKSILFSHDVTSFVNVSPDHSFEDGHLVGLSNDLDIPKQWGYAMNAAFRNVLAMDRYGVSADTDTTLSDEMKLQGSMLRQEQNLTVHMDTLEAEVNKGIRWWYKKWLGPGNMDLERKSVEYFLTRNIDKALLSNNRDIAFAANTYDSQDNTAQAYSETHGFTNATLNHYLEYDKDYLGDFENKTQKLNLRNDLLVQGDDASGEGRAKVTSENEGLITHYPYEIGSEFISAPTHHQYYQLNLDQDEDGDGEGDVVVWYCMSGSQDAKANKVYANNKNDARNNYYIYNIGNVTYTGIGHSALEHNGSDLEAKLLVNTIVAAYKAGVEPPDIRITETAEKSSAKKKYEYITYDNAVSDSPLSKDVSYYFSITDPNLVNANKKLSMEYFYNNGGGDMAIPADQIEVWDETVNSAVGTEYTEGHVYRVTVKGGSSMLNGDEMTLKARTTLEFNYYGRAQKLQSTAQLTVLKTTLFDLN